MLKLFPQRGAVGLIGALALAGCASFQNPFQRESEAAPPPAAPAVLPTLPPGFQPEEIVGRWGFASYHKEGDRTRTEAAAKAQCNKPYVINRGASGGVMMHLADDAKPSELRLKGAPGGKTYVGPEGPPASPHWCCAGWIRKSRAGTAPGSTCAAARAPEDRFRSG